MPQMIVGLDVGTSSIRITQIESSLFRFEFVDFAEHHLPVNTDLPREQLIANFLRVLFSQGAIPTSRVIASIPGRLVSSRIIRLPFSDKKKIQQTIPFEIEGLVPLPLGSVLLDYEIVESGPEGTAILAFIVEKEVLGKHLAMFKDGGLDPYAVIPPPVALANLWREISPHEDRPLAVIDLGETETSMAVLTERALQFGRSWAVGGRDLTAALAAELGIPNPQAREKKENEADMTALRSGSRTPEAVQMAGIIERALAPILVGIKQTFLSVSQSTGIRVEKVLVCGKGSRLKGLSAYLSETLQIEVSPVVFCGPMSTHILGKEADNPTVAVSLGLACHAIRDMRSSKINLRTGELAFVSERAELKRQIMSGGIMLGVLLVMLMVLFGMQYRARSQEYRALSDSQEKMAVETFPELRSIPAGSTRISAMKTRLTQEMKESDLFSPLSPDSLSVLDIMHTVTEAVPADVRIDVRELAIEGDKVRFEGETSSYNAAEQIKQNLMASGIFVSAEMPEAKDSLDQSKVKFRMILQLPHEIL